MEYNNDEIFILSEEKVDALPVRALREGILGETLEGALQKLLEKHPSIIPGRQIDPGSDNPPKFILLRREAPVGSWSLDHLLVDQNGILTLLECKLAQNPESRRDVIGQIVEYAANSKLAWGDGKLRDLANEYWARLGTTFDDVYKSTFETDLELEDFWKLTENNLNNGKIRLLIAGDEIRPEVRRMIEYLNQEMEHVEVLGLELRCYGSDGNNLVLVPTIIGQSQIRSDKRGNTSLKQLWTVEDLTNAFRSMQETILCDHYIKILEWAESNGSLMLVTAQNPAFGIESVTGRRLLSVYKKEGVWLHVDPKVYQDAEIGRGALISKLSEADIYTSKEDPDSYRYGKISLETDDSVKILLTALEPYIRKNR